MRRGAIRCLQVTNWSGTCYIFPLLGAFIADSYLGRYKTIIVFSIIYIIVSHCKDCPMHVLAREFRQILLSLKWLLQRPVSSQADTVQSPQGLDGFIMA